MKAYRSVFIVLVSCACSIAILSGFNCVLSQQSYFKGWSKSIG